MCALGTVTKVLVKGLEGWEIKGQLETIQTTALSRGVWEGSWRLDETSSQSNSSEKPSANPSVETSQKRKKNSKCRLCSDRRNDQSHNKWMQQISTEGVQGETRQGRQGDPLWNEQEI